MLHRHHLVLIHHELTRILRHTPLVKAHMHCLIAEIIATSLHDTLHLLHLLITLCELQLNFLLHFVAFTHAFV